jgi:5-formyltetrahydrofolate cyclo-ligase
VTEQIIITKATLRRTAYAARVAQDHKQSMSQLICDRLIALSVYRQAQTIMWYLHCRSEVQTLASVARESSSEKQLIIPYCTEDQLGTKQLGLWPLTDLDELVPGTWGILEPPQHCWQQPEKIIDPKQLDLVLVPGVAFDDNGARLGNGLGYYDNLLSKVREDCVLIGVCFQCQLFDNVPMDEHDIYLDWVMTEQNLYKGIGRK